MGQMLSLASALLTTALAASSSPAWALQSVEGSDGATVEGVLSLKEPTRIRIDGAAIVNVFGNIYSSNCGQVPAPSASGTPAVPQINPAGEIVLECDADKGEVYVRPVGASLKPVNLFVSSAAATYTLLLRKSDTPADTIVIRDKAVRQAKASSVSPGTRTPVHVRALKGMLVAMASDKTPSDLRVDEVARPVQLWKEARFILTHIYEGRGLVGERYVLTNVSKEDMVVAEQEFDREGHGVQGVAIENHNLRPGDSTVVYVIRTGN